MRKRYNGRMSETPGSGPERFARELTRRGMHALVHRLPDSTRTAPEAAAAIGCEVAEIAKSIVFRDCDNDVPLLVIASGINRVDTDKVRRLAGVTIGRADAGFVREHTGYAIGGVPPFGHAATVRTYIDEQLFALDQVWAAAGGPFDVFPTTAGELLAATGGTRADIKA